MNDKFGSAPIREREYICDICKRKIEEEDYKDSYVLSNGMEIAQCFCNKCVISIPMEERYGNMVVTSSAECLED